MHYDVPFDDIFYFQVKNNDAIALSGQDKWCWEQSFIDLEVGAEDVKGVDFVQKGFWVNIISSHDVDGLLTQPDGSRTNLNIKVGLVHIKKLTLIISY